MKKLTSLFFFLFVAIVFIQAQHLDPTQLNNIEKIILPEQNNEVLFQQEMNDRRPGRATRFAVSIPVNISPDHVGVWTELEDGNALWQVRIKSEKAKSLNFGFTQFHMPRSASFMIYTVDELQKLGPFSRANNESHNELWTPIIEADDVILEIKIAFEDKNDLALNLTKVNHAFLGFGELAALSGSCNLDVICGAEDGWDIVDGYRDIIRSVGMYTLNGIQTCTGFLVNNQREDCTPYFITANHCGVNNNNDQTMVVYWNYENSTCREPNTPASGANGDGNFNTFNMGATRRANASSSDFCLVELEEPVTDDADAFMAGWDATKSVPTLAIGIHHPGTEEKRISFEDDPLSPDGNYLRVNDWDIGTTEGGSSGSPIFDENKRAVGQLFGGGAACGNDLSDIYGWFNASWDGPNAGSRLKDWLDPDNTGTMIMDGTDAIGCNFSIGSPEDEKEICASDIVDFVLIVSPNYTAEVTLSLSGLPAGLSHDFSVNPVAPGDTTILSISNTGSLGVGTISLTVEGTDNVESSTTALAINVIETPTATNLLEPADEATGVNLNTLIEWEAVPMASEYYFELSKEENFASTVLTSTQGNNATNVTNLEFGTTYFWRVTTTNACGTMISTVNSFTTLLDLTILSTPTSLSVCPAGVATFSLTLGANFAVGGATLSAENLPPGATANFDVNPAAPGSTVVVSIGDLESATAMTYLVKITADDGTNSSFRNLGLILKSNPGTPSLSSPDNNATNVSVVPSLSWNSASQTSNYLVELADNAAMTNPLISQEVNGTGYVLNATDELGGEKDYYWRVTAQNECTGIASEIYSFTTEFTESINYLGNLSFELMPNPSQGLVQIKFGTALSEELQIEIFAVNGQKMESYRWRQSSQEVNLDLANYANGVYLLRMIHGTAVFTEKLILQK